MGSPSRNVQYHPPRLSEDRLNLPQPHSPSLPYTLLREIGNAPIRTQQQAGILDAAEGDHVQTRLYEEALVSRADVEPRDRSRRFFDLNHRRVQETTHLLGLFDDGPVARPEPGGGTESQELGGEVRVPMVEKFVL